MVFSWGVATGVVLSRVGSESDRGGFVLGGGDQGDSDQGDNVRGVKSGVVITGHPIATQQTAFHLSDEQPPSGFKFEFIHFRKFLLYITGFRMSAREVDVTYP